MKKQPQPEPDKEDKEFWQKSLEGTSQLPTQNFLSHPAPEIKVKPHINYEKAYNGAKLDDISSGKLSDIDGKTAQKFRMGKIPIEARLDLHGYTEKEAWEELHRFIKNAYLQQKRCLIVITGKGNRIYENDDILATHGILREQLPHWLNHKDLRPLILACCEAQPKDGGSGAYYILLRRQKS